MRPLLAAIASMLLVATVGCSSKPKVAEVKDVVNITVDKNGFSPSEIPARRGRPITLVFTRTSDETCATEVVIPSENIRKALPLNQVVSLSFVPAKAGKIRFACAMNMVSGDLEVLPRRASRPRGDRVIVGHVGRLMAAARAGAQADRASHPGRRTNERIDPSLCDAARLDWRGARPRARL